MAYHPDDILKAEGPHFAWAAQFFAREYRIPLSRLYAFCRFVDDGVDEAATHDEQARRFLDQLRLELDQGDSPRAVTRDFIDLMHGYDIELETAMALIDGVEQDIGSVRLTNFDDVIRYAYGVAGTVGLMICDIMGVDDPMARYRAIDFGIALQLVNIARDVGEDWENDRLYLPIVVRKVPDNNLSGDQAPADTVIIQDTIHDLLDVARFYYDSGCDGLPIFDDRRLRIGFRITGDVYFKMTEKIAARPSDAWRQTVTLNLWDKISASIGAIRHAWHRDGSAVAGHDARLHRPIHDLPDTHSETK
jgi:phytoene synthase